jgi:uncharacterized protein
VNREAFEKGARLFDEGAFWEAHEAWEERWRVESDEAERRFLQGLIQIAAGFHKLLVIGSSESAARLLAKGLAKLTWLPPDLDLVAFRDDVDACARALTAGRFEREMIPKLR